jgi:lipoprotein-releasing system ATP-binding protein
VEDIVVDVTSASREHRSGATRVMAIDAVSLRVVAGEAVAVVGPSGAGKTTLLNLISGLDRPTSGHVSVVFQDSYLLPGLTALENVTAAGTRWRNRRQVAAEATTLLEAVGLGDRMDFPPSIRGRSGTQATCTTARSARTTSRPNPLHTTPAYTAGSTRSKRLG